MTEHSIGEARYGLIHFLQQSEPGVGDIGGDDSLVLFLALLSEEMEGLEPSKQARDVWIGRDHAIADARAGQPVRMSPAQDAQHVVLRGGDVPAFRIALHGALKAVGCPKKV